MSLKPILVVLLTFTINTVVTQSIFKEFKELEERVKYLDPSQLQSFSNSIDTSSALNKAIFYWSSGKAEYWLSNYPKAYIQLEKATQYIEPLENPNLLAELYLDLSSSLRVVDQNGRALSYLLDATSILEKTGTTEQKARSKISLGEMYRKIGEYEAALKVLHQTRKLVEINSYNYARCMNRLAAVHSESGPADSSLYYSFKALETAQMLNEPDLIATSENEIGYMYRVQERFDEALPRHKRADSLWRSVGMLHYAVNAMHHISVIYGSRFQVDKGLDITHKAYNLVKGKGWYQIETRLMEDLKSFHFHLGDKDSVLFYDRERLQAVVNWRQEQNKLNTRMVEILYTQKQNEQTIREQKILLENEELEIAAARRERSNLMIVISLIGLSLFIIFIYAYKQRKLKNELAKENTAKESKNEELLEALAANEALVQEISHRVKNNLAVLSGLLSMQAARSDNKKVVKELNDSILRIESIATIHKKLYDKRSDAKVDMKDALEELSRNILTAMGKNPRDCLKTEVETCDLDIAKSVTLCLIINEVITNSCKYGSVNPEQKLHIELLKNQDKITCRIIDQGEGFDPNKKELNSDSLGIYLIKLLAKQLKANINWHKTEENFIFSIHIDSDE